MGVLLSHRVEHNSIRTVFLIVSRMKTLLTAVKTTKLFTLGCWGLLAHPVLGGRNGNLDGRPALPLASLINGFVFLIPEIARWEGCKLWI